MTVLTLMTTIVLSVGRGQAPAPTPHPDLRGNWVLVSATYSRDGGATEQPTTAVIMDYAAFNCGHGCRVGGTASTLTVENALFEAQAGPSKATATIAFDGQPHQVVNLVNPESPVDATARWQGANAAITSMLLGRPMTQSIVLENGQLVVRTTSTVLRTFRYARK